SASRSCRTRSSSSRRSLRGGSSRTSRSGRSTLARGFGTHAIVLGTFYMPAPPGKPASLSIFFPAFNDGGTIASMVIRAVKAASALTPDFEVIVVDDGSADGTAGIADDLARTYPQVRAVHHPKNRDYGAARQTGFRSATKDL